MPKITKSKIWCIKVGDMVLPQHTHNTIAIDLYVFEMLAEFSLAVVGMDCQIPAKTYAVCYCNCTR